ncbi:RNA polymerase sigma factor [Oleiagrimonas soli]|uniref:RNA polymerase sigma-70 factor (ECF subfamily) n=1 Tax=Oleiagrimonas soli TaxID=1543381 RepID=A0A099CX02_9GAMM|nr:sigma-70 family RNA polymerase sigma factor [Oleiagrimonas soli]KGI78284.1 RNA polymerase subunit sigma-24 [Oleiagrimonas soli]MBB6183230.1 RNA polymerase sigma-70 factor (ECF subfamily) [Oleiagrimonas soli]
MSRNNELDAYLRACLPRLRRFAHSLTRDQTRADDLVQAALERAVKRWDSRREPEALQAWLFSIVYRQFLDSRRRAKRYAWMLERLGHEEGFAPSAQRHTEAHAMLEALDALPEPQRNLLVWVTVEGLSYREVAEILDVPIGTVMSRLSRARRALRSLCEGDAVSSSPHLRLLK